MASLNRLGDHNYPLVRSPLFWFCLAYCGFIGGKRIPINRKRTKQVILRWPIGAPAGGVVGNGGAKNGGGGATGTGGS